MGGWRLIDCATVLQVHIHGPMTFSENVDRIVVNSRHRTNTRLVRLLNKFVKNYQWKLTWIGQSGTPDFPCPPMPTPYPVLTAAQERALRFVYRKCNEKSEAYYKVLRAKVINLGYTPKDLQKLVMFMVSAHCIYRSIAFSMPKLYRI